MKTARNNIIQKFGKLFGNKPKEESLATIFKPLTGIEEKVTIRKAIIKENILKLEEAKSKIDSQIKSYEEESKNCDLYLNSLGNFIY